MRRSLRTLARVPDLDGALCPACGGELTPWRFIPAAEPDLGDVRYRLDRCARCGSAVTAGPAPVHAHDTGAYQPGAPRLYRLALPLLRTFDRQRLSLLRPFAPPPGRLLDAGAGRGRFVATARAAGYDAFGIEPSARGAQAAALLGAPVEQVGIEDALIAERSLDAVTLWHVLEHIERPSTALERLRGWLRPGGMLLVGVPNLASLQARLGRERWYHYDVPRHRVHFTVRGLTTLLAASGFTVLGTRQLLLEHNMFGMWESAMNRITSNPSYLYNVLKRNAPLRSRDLPLSVVGLAGVPLAAFAEGLAGLSGRGGTVAVLAARDRAW
jgi:SAM-dependent methyltransferase